MMMQEIEQIFDQLAKPTNGDEPIAAFYVRRDRKGHYHKFARNFEETKESESLILGMSEVVDEWLEDPIKDL